VITLTCCILLLPVCNEKKCVVISRCFREDSIPKLLIVNGPVSSHPWFFSPHVEEFFHVNLYISCVCLCLFFLLHIYWLKVFSHKPVGGP
jgi:hypothetical protein